MQLLPSTAKEQAKKMGIKEYNLENPEHSLLLGAGYLKRMIDMFDGDIKKGLTAYHSGARNVQRGTLGPIGSVYAQQVLGRLNEG
jgi:soluble lytic murein transglycosylase-like protein